MGDLINLFADHPSIAFGAACVTSLIALVWLLGTVPSAKQYPMGRAWIGFWIGTACYWAVDGINMHMCTLIADTLPPGTFRNCVAGTTPLVWWLPQLALDFASFCLLRGLLNHVWPAHAVSGRAVLARNLAAMSVVLCTRIIDIVYLQNDPGGHTFAHQSLDALIIGAWAWMFRDDLDVSAAVLAYALAQVPYPTLLPQPNFILANQVLWHLVVSYVGLKLVLAFALPKFLRTACPPQQVSSLGTGVNDANEMASEP